MPAYQSDGSGTIDGAEVTAKLCHIGTHVYVSPYTTPAGQALLMLDSQSSDSPPLEAPAGATGGSVTGMLSIDSPSPGRYSSAGSRACGQLQYYFQLPLPAGTDCDGGAPPSCPQNCTTLCSSSGCLPCAPNPPTVAYSATATSDCLGSTQPASGSWQIELTSAASVDGDASGAYYLVHGSLSAKLLADDGGPATLSLTF